MKIVDQIRPLKRAPAARGDFDETQRGARLKLRLPTQLGCPNALSGVVLVK